MFEELKDLFSLLKELPDLALWIALAVFTYKTLIVGSIYGVIKYCVFTWYKIQGLKQEIKITDIKELTGYSFISDEAGDVLKQIFDESHYTNRNSYVNIRNAKFIHANDLEYVLKLIKADKAKSENNKEPQ